MAIADIINIGGNVGGNDSNSGGEYEQILSEEERWSYLKISALLGPAGSGKTTILQKKIANGERIKLCATTGIAAVNLSSGLENQQVMTLASTLRFYDTASLQESYAKGHLQNTLKKLVIQDKFNVLAIDEVSMMPAVQFEILCHALLEVNMLKGVQEKGGLRLVLTGDFCQLPPVEEGSKYVFESKYWKYVNPIYKLTKIHRQTNPLFLEALAAGRKGEGTIMVRKLREIEQEDQISIFQSNLAMEFEGVTIFGTNKECDRFNLVRLSNLVGRGHKEIRITNYRWGEQLSEWKKYIPDVIELAEKAYVMILSNDIPDFRFANGSCGWLHSYENENGEDTVKIVLEKPRKPSILTDDEDEKAGIIKLNRVFRRNLVSHKEEIFGELPEIPMGKKEWNKYSSNEGDEGDTDDIETYEDYLRELTKKHKKPNKKYYDFVEEKWCIGEVYYIPLRLAYAITVYKSQGLTLDKVQIYYSPNSGFFGQAGMSYVALSRVRDCRGLKLVGSPELINRRTNVSGRVLQWT